MLLLLLLVTVVFTYINIEIAKGDLTAPVSIACMSFLVGVFFSYLGADSWDFQLSSTAFWAIVVGLTIMTFTQLISMRRVKVPSGWVAKSEIIYSDKYVMWATILSVIFTLLYGINAYRVGMRLGGSGLNAFAYMKNAYLENAGVTRMNLIIRQLFKPVIAIAYVNMFLFINALISKQNDKKRKICGFISILSAITIVIFSGSRTEALQLISGGVFMFSVLWRENRGWQRGDNKKSFKVLIRKIWPAIFAFMALAFFSRNIVKTANNELSATASFLQYIIYYVGSSVAVFDKKIRVVFSNGSIMFGNEAAKSIMHKHVYLGKLTYGGNTATIFISIFNGGLFYMIVRILMIFFIGNTIYRSLVLKSESSYKRNRNLILFSMTYYVFTMAYYSDCFGLVTKKSNLLVMLFVLLYHKFISFKPMRRETICE